MAGQPNKTGRSDSASNSRAEPLGPVDWFLRFIRAYRAIAKFTRAERKDLINALNYLRPTQIDIFAISDPACEIIVNSQFGHRPDKEVSIHGPLALRALPRYVDKLARTTAWNRPDEADPARLKNRLKDRTLGACLISTLAASLDEIEDWTLANPPKAGPINPLGGMGVTTQSFLRVVPGSIAEIDLPSFLGSVLALAKQPGAPHRGLPASPTPILPRFRYYTTDIFPPVILGPVRWSLRLAEVVDGKVRDRLHTYAVRVAFAGRTVFVDRLGNITVKCRGREEARAIVNTIFASLSLVGLATYSVRDTEIGESQFDETTGIVHRTQYHVNSAPLEHIHVMAAARHLIRGDAARLLQRPEIPLGIVLDRIKWAERAFRAGVGDLLVLQLEASTQLGTHAYDQAFSTGWIIIERTISDDYEMVLTRKKVKGKRLEKLMNPTYWSTDSILEFLSLTGNLPDDEYTLIMELKRIRNAYAHKGNKIQRDDATRCLEYAEFKLVSKLVQLGLLRRRSVQAQ